MIIGFKRFAIRFLQEKWKQQYIHSFINKLYR